MSDKPLSWLRRVEAAIDLSQEIPMWGGAPPFPVEELSAKLGEALSLGPLETEVEKATWRDADELKDGMGSDPLISGIELSPIETPLLLMIPTGDAEKLSRWALSPDGKGKGLRAPEMQRGFYRYLLLHLLQIADEMEACEDLSPRLTEGRLPTQPAYTVDIALRHKSQTVWGRIICPAGFHAEYKRHFAAHPPSHFFETATMPVTLSLEAGSADLTLEEWKSVKPGDYLVLDLCTYQPGEQSGSFLGSLSGQPLFQIRSKEGVLKVLDYAQSFEEKSMDETFDDDLPEDASVQEAPAPEMIKTEQIPLTVTVEVARISLPLNKLLALKPGNTLDLAISPDHGVNLTVGGKVVGRGELIQVGETLGVQVSEVSP